MSWKQIVQTLETPLFSVGSTDVSLQRIVVLCVMMLLVWWIAALIERSIRRLGARKHAGGEAQSGIYAMAKLLRYVVWILGSFAGLDLLGFDLASLAIMGGAIGVGVGLGLQSIFANFVSGIILLLDRTLKVGDFVDLQSGVMGTVSEISIRYTRVTTNDNVDVIVPNSEFVNGRVTNWTLDDRRRRLHIPFGVAYGTDKHQVREAGIAAALRVAGTLNSDTHKPDVWLVRFGDNSLDFELVVWVDHLLMKAPGRANAQYMWEIETELAARGIEIPFPQRDLHVRSGVLDVRMQPAKSAE